MLNEIVGILLNKIPSEINYLKKYLLKWNKKWNEKKLKWNKKVNIAIYSFIISKNGKIISVTIAHLIFIVLKRTFWVMWKFLIKNQNKFE